MKLKLFLISAFVLTLTSCFNTYYCDPDLILHNHWDAANIPDKYNTGADEKTSFLKLTTVGSHIIGDGNNLEIVVRQDSGFDKNGNPKERFYSLTSHGPNLTNLPDRVVIRNYDFSDANFVTTASTRYAHNKHIIFENCKFKGFRNDAVRRKQSRIYFTFNNCSFGGGVHSSYITLNNCQIGGFTSDAINPLREFYANNLYICNLFTQKLDGEKHIDGIQIFGDSTAKSDDCTWVTKNETGNIHFKNVRFEIPSFHYAGNVAGVNACVMFQLEFSDVDDVSFENLIVNGGGKWFPIYMDHGKNNIRTPKGIWSHNNLVMKNVMVSNNFGKIFAPDILEDAVIENVDHHDTLYVSSVWKDASGTAHIIVTNDTSIDKTLTVKSNKGTKTFKISHCPSNWALGGERDGKVNPNEALQDKNGKSYMNYRWEDMPFDVDIKITDNPDFILCYDGERQIRYVRLDNRLHYYKEIP